MLFCPLPKISSAVGSLCRLHDIDDWKYSGSETAGIEKASAFLREQGAPDGMVAKVASTIKGVGFKDQLDKLNRSGAAPAESVSPELAAVRDADRLDAIG